MHLIEVLHFSLREPTATVLEPLSFSVPPHHKLAIAGESGAGKSTLLQLIAGLIEPSTGEIRIAGRKVRGPAIALVPGHPGVAYLSQKSTLPNFLRVEQVLRYANQRPAAEAQELYRLCRIEPLLGRPTSQLSGGEQQRVALARLLLGAPQLLLLDEPFSNLDRAHKRTLQGIIEELSTRLGITCVLVSHDATDTLSWADEILVLERGRLVQQGPPARLYQQPVSEYVAGLFGDYNLVAGADAQALAHSTAPLLVRPEQWQLGPAGSGAIAGQVRAVRFLGSYYEVDIQLTTNMVRARAVENTWRPGEAVGLTILGQPYAWPEGK